VVSARDIEIRRSRRLITRLIVQRHTALTPLFDLRDRSCFCFFFSPGRNNVDLPLLFLLPYDRNAPDSAMVRDVSSCRGRSSAGRETSVEAKQSDILSNAANNTQTDVVTNRVMRGDGETHAGQERSWTETASDGVSERTKRIALFASTGPASRNRRMLCPVFPNRLPTFFFSI
jgi:hypothetical protein